MWKLLVNNELPFIHISPIGHVFLNKILTHVLGSGLKYEEINSSGKTWKYDWTCVFVIFRQDQYEQLND